MNKSKKKLRKNKTQKLRSKRKKTKRIKTKSMPRIRKMPRRTKKHLSSKKRQTMTGMRMNPKKSQRRRRFLRPKIILRANLHPSQNLLHKKRKTTTKTTLNQKKKKSPRPMRNRNSLMIRMTINEAVHKGVFCPCLWSFRPDQGW